jgi:hypothetical protein
MCFWRYEPIVLPHLGLWHPVHERNTRLRSLVSPYVGIGRGRLCTVANHAKTVQLPCLICCTVFLLEESKRRIIPHIPGIHQHPIRIRSCGTILQANRTNFQRQFTASGYGLLLPRGTHGRYAKYGRRPNYMCYCLATLILCKTHTKYQELGTLAVLLQV